MVKISESGASPTSLPEYIEAFQAIYRAVLGADVDLAAETVQGQIIGSEAAMLVEVDGAVVAISNGLSISRGQRFQLADAVSFLRLVPTEATRSTVTLTLTVTAGVTVPAGSRASGIGGALWRTTASRTGSGTVAAESVDAGPVAAAAASITQIVDVVAGWTAVTNVDAATLGLAVETTETFRRRVGRHTGRLAFGSLAAIEAAVLEVDGVIDSLVKDNATSASVTTQGQAIAARSLFVVVSGGASADIGQAIYDSKPPGIPTIGPTAVAVTERDASGTSVGTTTINYRETTEVPCMVVVPITLSPGFPGDGVQRIQQGVADYVNALLIAEPIDTTQILFPIVAVRGLTLGTMVITRKIGAGSVTDRTGVNLYDKLTLLAADVTVTVA